MGFIRNSPTWIPWVSWVWEDFLRMFLQVPNFIHRLWLHTWNLGLYSETFTQAGSCLLFQLTPNNFTGTVHNVRETECGPLKLRHTFQVGKQLWQHWCLLKKYQVQLLIRLHRFSGNNILKTCTYYYRKFCSFLSCELAKPQQHFSELQMLLCPKFQWAEFP